MPQLATIGSLRRRSIPIDQNSLGLFFDNFGCLIAFTIEYS